ncbi:aminoglycoside phosphotransferase family protein [Rathayibacter tanaceti]|uniref:aminoglycoside phosphotransferase family protein n=1 Tax=Rathayibacter tanaceti TaxID=1671680 RepID=UPI0018EE5A06|nr:aminoglycoside phosphotransferase family protein [Rathayibacter tanaceti]
MDDDQELELPGGGTTRVVRVGDTVRRPFRAWSPAVHRLLETVSARGFGGAPVPLGIDGHGREILSFLPGEVGNYPLSAEMRSRTALVSAAQLLRRYHDATVDLAADRTTGFRLEPLEPVEVVCHSDFAPYNVVFRGGTAVAVIDFDYARPGPRAWDLAYALYRFAPLSVAFGAEDEFSALGSQVRRLRAFLDAYGCDRRERRAALDLVVPRLRALIALMTGAAADGDENFARHIEDGHVGIYVRDIAYIRENERVWLGAVG